MRQRDIERLAKLKIRKGEIEEDIKELQSKMIAEDIESAETEMGVLKLQESSTYIVPSNFNLIDALGISDEAFLEAASIGSTAIKKLGGDLKNLIKKGLVIKKPKTPYYKLTKY